MARTDDDQLAYAIITKIGAEPLPNLNDLRRDFYLLKSQTIFNIFVPEDVKYPYIHDYLVDIRKLFLWKTEDGLLLLGNWSLR